MEDLREWALQRFTPVVMVVCSPEAEAICQEANGLTIVDLLRPFGYLHQLSVPVRTVGEQAYRIREFRVRFHQADMIFQPPADVADMYLRGVLHSAAQESNLTDVPDVVALLRSGAGIPASRTPWWARYRAEFFRMLSFGELETYDHPVACLLVLHAHSDAPVLEAFGRLWAGAKKPPLMVAGKMEGRMVMHHLLVHADNAHPEGGYAGSEEKLRAARAALGSAAVHLVRINSGRGDPASVLGYSSVWKEGTLPGMLPQGGAGEPPSRPPMPASGYGACLTKANLDDIKRFMDDFAVRALLPAMEARVRALNHQVTSTRKGLRNQLKTLLWRKTGSAVGGPGGGTSGRDSPQAGGSRHGHSPRGSFPAAAGAAVTNGSGGAGLGGVSGSVEAQMRALADLAFMMQDYDTAISTLRLLAGDLKTDKAWRQYAAAQEMTGLAIFMAGGAGSEVAVAFKEAFFRYNTGASQFPERDSVRYATRAMVLAAEHARQSGAFADATYALMKAHFQEENLRAALLLEQAALCLLRMQPPAVRKYAFHMVLAGLRYNACDQKGLGTRAYKQVLSVYQNRRWTFIEEHIHDALGKHSRDAGDYDAALAHFAAMLHCPQSTPYWQAQYLRQFLECVMQAAAVQGRAPVLALPLPEVDCARLAVHADSQVCHAGAESRAQPEELWHGLEAPLLSGSDAALVSWLDGGGGSSSSAARLAALALGTGVAGEALEVHVALSNPLALELEVSRLRLLFQPEPRPAADEGPADLAAYAQAEQQTVLLKAGETARVALRLTPLQAGLLTVTGLEWVLNGQAPGYKLFAERRPPHRRTASRAMPKADSQCLSFNILSPLPRLEARVEQLPAALLEGELRLCRLVLRNRGAFPLQALRAMCSSPDVWLPPTDADLAGHAASSALSDREQPAGTSSLEEPGVPLRRGMRLHTWPAGRALAPGDSLIWPLWLHPHAPGTCSFHLSLYYEPQAAMDGLKYRLLRLSQIVSVLPSLSVAPALAPSRADLDSYILRLALHNLQGSQALMLQQLVCMGSPWRVSSLAARSSSSSSRRSSSADGSAGDAAVGSAPSRQVLPNLELPPSTSSLAYFRLHPPDQAGLQGAPAEQGPEWVQALAGPVAHFHAERLRAQQPEHEADQPRAPRPTGSAPRDGPPGADASSGAASPAEPARGADVLLIWSSPSDADGGRPETAGAHHLRNLRAEERAPIRAVLQGDLQLRHNFRGGSGSGGGGNAASFCTARVTLLLRNCHATAAASLCVEAGPLSSQQMHLGEGRWRAASASPEGAAGATGAAAPLLPPPPQQGEAAARAEPAGCPSCPDYVWVGQTRTLIPSLPPGERIDVILQVAVFAAGVYEVTDYVIRWALPAHDNVQYSQPGPPFLISVEEAVQ